MEDFYREFSGHYHCKIETVYGLSPYFLSSINHLVPDIFLLCKSLDIAYIVYWSLVIMSGKPGWRRPRTSIDNKGLSIHPTNFTRTSTKKNQYCTNNTSEDFLSSNMMMDQLPMMPMMISFGAHHWCLSTIYQYAGPLPVL